MLLTNLDHLETSESVTEAQQAHDNVVICSGRMGSMCLPVYAAMERLREKYPHVRFFDQEFDGPASAFIRNLPECARFMGLPFTVYFRKGKVAATTASIQSEEQIVEILDQKLGKSS